MDNKLNVIRDFLVREEYKILEVDEGCGVITVRYQMNLVHICPNSNDDFVSILLPGVDELTEDNAIKVMMRCSSVAANQKVVKAYPSSANNVMIAYEFNFYNADDLYFQIEKGLDAVASSKALYKRLAADEEE